MPDVRWIREESRQQWAALGKLDRREERDELFRSARAGEPYPDPEVALIALHWSWAVLGPPGARRSYPWWDLMLHAAPAAMFENVYDGTKQHDMRFQVRREAHRVESANLAHLRELGIDIGFSPR
jgi:hypothetical protein